MSKKKQSKTKNQPLADRVRQQADQQPAGHSQPEAPAAVETTVAPPENELAYRTDTSTVEESASGEFPVYQERVDEWLRECFGDEVPYDKTQRNHRFLEEALELVQACNCSRQEAHKLVDYVFGRPRGEVRQEVGGVMLALSGLCTAQDVNMDACAESGLEEVWTRIPEIREKQERIPVISALPR